MALTPGTRVGSYEITAQLGVGGMGEVYRATDPKLGREVAIKVLPDSVAQDTERLARFDREARTLASLNHPNIAAIYGLEDADGSKALVMELVEGPTLADRIAEGPIPVDEALAIARQVAEALGAAHEQGIVHRDLKPANVKVREDGTVKVLDFGLAKAVEPSGAMSSSQSMSPTITTPAMTQAGIILGTAAYMSPEQAKGKAVDARADVWAFGTLLFEMLSGRRAFDGEDITDVLGAVVRLEPNWNALPAAVPERVTSVLRVCLLKDPRQRAFAIHDVRLALEGAFETVVQATDESVTPVSIPSWRRGLPLAVTAALIVVVSATVTLMLRPGERHEVVRFAHPLPEDNAFRGTTNNVVAIAPDGRHFVYNGNGLQLRALNAIEGRLIPNTQAIFNPFFSPDGDSVAYWENGELRRISVTGGASTPLTTTTGPLMGASWGTDGYILYAQADGIWQVRETGGESTLLISANDRDQMYGPQRLPGGDWILYTVTQSTNSTRWDDAEILVELPSRPESRQVLRRGASDARYVPSGHIIYAFENVLYAMSFDPDSRVAGYPEPVVEDVRRAYPPVTGAAFFAVSDTGTLVYVESGSEQARTLALVDRRSGSTERLPIPPHQYLSPRLSPDGTRVAVQTDGERNEIWTYDFAGGTAIRKFASEGNSLRPVWTPRSDRITFASDREDTMSLYWQNADGSGVPERLTTAKPGTAHWPEAWSPDGRTLVYKVEYSVAGNWSVNANEMDLWLLSLDKPEEPQLLAGDLYPILELGASFSPNGEWLAYTVGDGPGVAYEIVATPFPPTGEIHHLSRDAGVMALWSHDGRELFYRPVTLGGAARQTLKSISVTTTPSLEFTEERAVPIGDFLSTGFYRSFDVMPDGDTFVVVLPADEEQAAGAPPPPQVQVVTNWFSELPTD